MRLAFSNLVLSRAAATALLCTFGGALSLTAAPAVSKPAASSANQPNLPVQEDKIAGTLIKFKMVKLPAGTISMPKGSGAARQAQGASGVVGGVSLDGVIPFTESANFMSLPGYVRYRIFLAEGRWISRQEAEQMIKGGGATPVAAAETAATGAMQEVEVKPFWIEQHETAWDEFDVFMFKLDLTDEEGAKINGKTRPSLPYGAPDRGFGHEGFAAISLAHHSGEAYCEWLSKKSGKKYRLPTEAEWEYACRAGAEDAKMTPEDVQKVAWVKENSDEKTHPVGEKAPNAWGLYDMLGNAGEWVTGYDGDWVLKGGSFVAPADKVNSTWRAKQEVSWHDPNKPKSKWWLADGPFAGFRIVRED